MILLYRSNRHGQKKAVHFQRAAVAGIVLTLFCLMTPVLAAQTAAPSPGPSASPVAAQTAAPSPGPSASPVAAPSPASSDQALDRDGLFKKALVVSPDVVDATIQLQAAKDAATYSGAIWQSAVTGTAGLTGPLGTSTTPVSFANQPPTTTTTAASVSATVTPLNMLSLGASLDSTGSIGATAKLVPFADTSAARNALRAYDDEQLSFQNTLTQLKTTVYQAWSTWAKDRRQTEVASATRDLNQNILADTQIKYDGGSASSADLETARETLLTSEKSLLDAQATEASDLYTLIAYAGFSPLDTLPNLAEPISPVASDLYASAEAILSAQKPPKPSVQTELARRAAERAVSDAGLPPTFLQGLGFGATYASKNATWQATVNMNLSLLGLSPKDAAARQRTIASTANAYKTALANDAKSGKLALVRLQSALALARLSTDQATQAQKTYGSQKIKTDNGSGSARDLQSAAISLQRAMANQESALWDLETQLLAWEN